MKILTRTKTERAWKLVESAAYRAESELQKLLAESPGLISIEDVRSGVGTLSIAIREVPLSIGSVDLLAFSAGGDIAVIECKLATNPEIKRKVIGQALEYGANMWRMTYDELDTIIKARTNKSLVDLVRDSVQMEDWDEEAFRHEVGSALEAGSFILMIVVDEITEDLSRIIRFMNACGNPAFSFAALEMRRFQSDQNEMLIPRIVGDSRGLTSKSGGTGRKQWNEASFFADASVRMAPEVVLLIKDLHDWSRQTGIIRYGTGAGSGSFTFYVERERVTASVFSVYSNGTLGINLGFMAKIYSKDEVLAFQEALSSIPSLHDIATTSSFYYNRSVEEAFPQRSYLNQFKEYVSSLPK